VVMVSDGLDMRLVMGYVKKVQTHMSYFLVSGPKFTALFLPREESFLITCLCSFHILTHSGDILDECLKLY